MYPGSSSRDKINFDHFLSFICPLFHLFVYFLMTVTETMNVSIAIKLIVHL